MEIGSSDLSQRLFQGKKRYTPDERLFFTELVARNADILESSDLDAASLGKKKKTWQHIQRQFNSVAGHTPRTVKQLKKAWDNHKTKQKSLQKYKMKVQNSQVEILEPKEEESYKGMASVHEQGFDRGSGEDECLDNTTPDGCIRVKNISELRQDPSSPESDVGASDTEGRDIPEETTADLNSALPQNHQVFDHKRPHASSKPSQIILSKRRGKLDVQVGHDSGVLMLLKREMLIGVQIAEIEKRKALAELRYKEEEQEYKKRMWELEIKILKKKLIE